MCESNGKRASEHWEDSMRDKAATPARLLVGHSSDPCFVAVCLRFAPALPPLEIMAWLVQHVFSIVWVTIVLLVLDAILRSAKLHAK